MVKTQDKYMVHKGCGGKVQHRWIDMYRCDKYSRLVDVRFTEVICVPIN
jgi:hypothetical protein